MAAIIAMRVSLSLSIGIVPGPNARANWWNVARFGLFREVLQIARRHTVAGPQRAVHIFSFSRIFLSRRVVFSEPFGLEPSGNRQRRCRQPSGFWRFPGRAKSCGQPLGESWPRAIRSGTGRGGDVTGSRVSVASLLVSGRGSWRLPAPACCRQARPIRWDRSATGA
jgi:hypothetical protein